jgi:hypothetical protein
MQTKTYEYTVTYTCKGLVYGKDEKEALGNIWRNRKRILDVELDEFYGIVDEFDYLPIAGEMA